MTGGRRHRAPQGYKDAESGFPFMGHTAETVAVCTPEKANMTLNALGGRAPAPSALPTNRELSYSTRSERQPCQSRL